MVVVLFWHKYLLIVSSCIFSVDLRECKGVWESILQQLLYKKIQDSWKGWGYIKQQDQLSLAVLHTCCVLDTPFSLSLASLSASATYTDNQSPFLAHIMAL